MAKAIGAPLSIDRAVSGLGPCGQTSMTAPILTDEVVYLPFIRMVGAIHALRAIHVARSSSVIGTVHVQAQWLSRIALNPNVD